MQSCIDKAERSKPSGIGPLCDLVAPAYNAEHKEGFSDLSPALVRLRLASGVVKTKIQPGRRGRAPGSKLSDSHKAAMQAGRTSSTSKRRLMPPEVYSQARAKLEKQLATAPDDFKANLQRIIGAFDRWYQRPTLKNAVRWFWLDSCNGYKGMIRDDPSIDSPLWYYRPYGQKSQGTNDEQMGPSDPPPLSRLEKASTAVNQS